MAPVPVQLPSLAEPVTFTGAEAESFVGGLPRELSDAAYWRLREAVAAAMAATSSQPANPLFE